MFDQNPIELIIITYKNAKQGLGQMYSPETLMSVIDEMRAYEGLSEGKSLDYLKHKISSGLDLTEEDEQDILATLALHQNPTLIDENGKIQIEE